jgi:uncharacterized 2Fe-2S/4Fe-4S cluster protein (DUF4445 family)
MRRVCFEPDNIEVIVPEGTNLLEAAIAAGVRISASCGGIGVCGTCKVRVQKGEVESQRTEKLSHEEYSQGIRQSCQSKVIDDLVVYVPVESRLEKAVLSREGQETAEVLATGWRFSPPLKKYFVELKPPSIDDNISDLSRVLRELKRKYQLHNMTVDYEVVRDLARVVREGDWKVTVTTLVTAVKPIPKERRRPRVIKIEPGDTRQKHYVLAFDIGTTTVWGQVLDLNRGKVVAQGVDFNGQISYGQDVISRIAYSQKHGLKKIHKAVIDTVNGVIHEILGQSRIDVADISHIVMAGNTTMIQLLLSIDPKYIRLSPYTPVANLLPPVKARSLGIEVGDYVYIFSFPLIASYVGGDIVSGVVGSGMYQRHELTLFIDIGTNGEVVIGNSEWMMVASCSAGPAFEGGGVKHGMVASDGAIEEFTIDGKTLEPTIRTINDAKPKGICGSGLINIVAGLFLAGVVEANGKFRVGLDSERVRDGSDGYEYVLAWAAETQTGNDIVITEVDIDNLIRAKAAVYAGCQTLVKSAGNTMADIERVIIAGAFGRHLDIENCIAIGLFPDIDRKRYTYIGNGSLLGARLVSFSTDLLDDARRVAHMMTNLELSENNDFMNNYVAAMFLPHTNYGDFPVVSRRLGKGVKI